MKVINQGEREIHHSKGILFPKKAAELDDAEANKLRKLYTGEVVSIDDITTGFEEVAASDVEDKPKKDKKEKAA